MTQSINCPSHQLSAQIFSDLPPTILCPVYPLSSSPLHTFLLRLFNFVFKAWSLSRLICSFSQREICASSFCLQLHHFDIIHQSMSLSSYKPSLSSLLPSFCHKLLLTLTSTHSVHCLGWSSQVMTFYYLSSLYFHSYTDMHLFSVDIHSSFL